MEQQYEKLETVAAELVRQLAKASMVDGLDDHPEEKTLLFEIGLDLVSDLSTASKTIRATHSAELPQCEDSYIRVERCIVAIEALTRTIEQTGGNQIFRAVASFEQREQLREDLDVLFPTPQSKGRKR